MLHATLHRREGESRFDAVSRIGLIDRRLLELEIVNNSFGATVIAIIVTMCNGVDMYMTLTGFQLVV